MKTAVLITGLLLLLAANIMMMYFSPYGLSAREGYQNAPANAGPPMIPSMAPAITTGAPAPMPAASPAPSASNVAPNAANTAAPVSAPNAMAPPSNVVEGFSSYFLSNAAGSKDMYEPIGAFDGVKLSTGNSTSSWRYTAPNEPLTGPAFEVGPDSLFMFKSNQCKPECCGASFSCGGGCVCTTPQQRQYIASRGGNRTAPEDSA